MKNFAYTCSCKEEGGKAFRVKLHTEDCMQCFQLSCTDITLIHRKEKKRSPIFK